MKRKRNEFISYLEENMNLDIYTKSQVIGILKNYKKVMEYIKGNEMAKTLINDKKTRKNLHL